MRELSVRAQLTLWYSLVTFAGLLLFGVLSFGALRFALFQANKSHLRGREQRLIQFLKDNKAERNPLPLSEQLRNYAVVTHEGNYLRSVITMGAFPVAHGLHSAATPYQTA